MNRMVDRLDRALYPRQSRNWDDCIFRDRVLSNLSPKAIILDIGAGAGIVPQMNFKGMVAKVCGIDLDPRVFSPGDTALTLVGHTNVHLWQVDPAPTYDFAVPRSFAASFYEWLFAASAKYGMLVRPA